MKTERRSRLLPALLAILLAPVTVRAEFIPVEMIFDDPLWSGSFSFDDTTGQPWREPELTVFTISSMTLEFSGVAIWDESEHSSLGNGAVVDSIGRAALFGSGTDTDTGLIFGTSIESRDDLILISWILGPEGSAFYEAFVSVVEPGTLGLLVAGIAGMALARRRRRGQAAG